MKIGLICCGDVLIENVRVCFPPDAEVSLASSACAEMLLERVDGITVFWDESSPEKDRILALCREKGKSFFVITSDITQKPIS